MKKTTFFFFGLLIANCVLGQNESFPPGIKIMTLGVFHFAYPNLDVVRTEKSQQISVLDEPYQSEIISVSKAIEAFKPTIICIEETPDKKAEIDSLFSEYKSGRFKLPKDEKFQLGFRIGKDMNLPEIYCVNDWGHHYDNIEALIKDSVRMSEFEYFYFHSPDTILKTSEKAGKVTSVISELYRLNDPDRIKDRLSIYLMGIFKYEEKPGDFTGVDFETGRWFNRNLRIFRNIQRVPHKTDDRILLIIGCDHLNLLNMFFDVSKEFELVSPVPYLDKAGKK